MDHVGAGPARAHDDTRAALPGRSGEPGPAGSGAPSWARGVLRLQSLAGNRAVTSLLGRGADGRNGAAEGFLYVGAYTFGRHPQFPTPMGQTYYAHKDIEIWPSFNLDVGRSLIPPFDYEAKPKKTDAAGNAWPVLATPESEEGYKMANEHPKHPGKEYWIRVGHTAAEKILAAEAQHVADLDEGWNLTGFAAKKAINQAAAEDAVTGDSPTAAKAAAVNKVVGLMGGLGDKIKGALEGGGRLEGALGPMMDNAFRQTQAKRDETGKHFIGLNYVTSGTNPDTNAERVLYEADPEAKADTQATSDVVNLGTIGG